MLHRVSMSLVCIGLIVMGWQAVVWADAHASKPPAPAPAPAAEPMKPVPSAPATPPVAAPSAANTNAAPAATPAPVTSKPAPVAATSPVKTEQASARPAGPDLEDLMHEMEDHYKALKKQVAQAEYQTDSLERIVLFQRLSLLAKTMTPPVIHRLPSDQRASKLTAYRKTMNQLIHRLSDLEAALLEGRFDDAPALLKKVHDVEDDGHAMFK